MEYKLDLRGFEGDFVRLSVVFLQVRAKTKYAFAPSTLDDASLDEALIAGSAGDELNFEPTQWLVFVW